MNSVIHIEVALAVAYALFLGGTAALLERLARHSHRRSERYRNAGFTYRQKYDLWECPAGQPLTRSETDYERRVVRYRAPGHICNSCSLKNNCTDSDEGRVLERRLDSWLESELRHFHRGISLALLLLAAVLLVAEGARHRGYVELGILGSFFFPIAAGGTRLFVSFLGRQNKL